MMHRPENESNTKKHKNKSLLFILATLSKGNWVDGFFIHYQIFLYSYIYYQLFSRFIKYINNLKILYQ